MTPPTDPRSRNATLAVVTLVSAVCFYFGTGLRPFWPATWLAPLPLL